MHKTSDKGFMWKGIPVYSSRIIHQEVIKMKKKIKTEYSLTCFRDSTIGTALIQAYLETDYRILNSNPFTLKVGVACPELAVLNTEYRVTSSAFITAYNPISQRLSDADNARQQAKLAQTLRQSGYVFLDGIGQHPSNDWPGEPGFLVLGIDLETAMKLGDQFEQNAIIWNNIDSVPELVLLR